MRKKMSGVERAKQFMPFSPLSEHGRALRAREQPFLERPLLAEDAQEELDSRLRSLAAGDRVLAVYYKDGALRHAEGAFLRVDTFRRVLALDGEEIDLDGLLALS